MAKILIIDDDADMLMAARMCVEEAGHEAIEAKNGKKGLEKVESEKPDLIILDVMMDTTSEGFEVALKLRSADPTSRWSAYREIPIIMLTAIHDTTEMQFAPDDDYLPVDTFIDKPFDPDELIATINELLAAPSVTS